MTIRRLADVAAFVTEAGVADYHYLRGNILKPEFERETRDAAIKGRTVGGAVAGAIFFGPESRWPDNSRGCICGLYCHRHKPERLATPSGQSVSEPQRSAGFWY